jgi:uncharacterized protein
MPSMRSLLLAAALLGAAAGAAEPPLPPPTGFVVDQADILRPETEARITRLLDELRAKTGVEIAVVTVHTTAPLDDFTYAMRLFDAWMPGRRGEDTGVVFLIAPGDRKVRIVTGYGLEGILPDGLVGAIQDEDVVPALRAGDPDGAVRRGIAALASRIAAARGVELTGVPPPRPRPGDTQAPPAWLVYVLLGLFVAFMIWGQSRAGRSRWRRRGVFLPGPFGGDFGGFGGGGGGFGGFGGGRSGGGGAGRSW